jgi:hypothetical protein
MAKKKKESVAKREDYMLVNRSDSIIHILPSCSEINARIGASLRELKLLRAMRRACDKAEQIREIEDESLPRTRKVYGI